MLSKLSKRRELKARNAILKAVYEDNLRIVGKKSYIISKKKISFLKIPVLIISFAILFILLRWDYLNVSLLEESHVKANPNVQKTSFKIMPGSISPSDYNDFISRTDILLSRIFGLEVRTIMIDPGHGGSDTGTIGKMKTMEKDITLDIAKRLQKNLKKYGYNVMMTRREDITMPLSERVELTRLSRTDLFISIHLNYLPNKPINIIETYYFGPTSDDKILKLAEQENVGSHYGLNDFKDIIEKIGDTLKLQESNKLAVSIQKSLFLNSRKHGRNVYDYGIKRAPFVVLLGVDVPAVLVEVSCLSNMEEEIKLNTEHHRENIAGHLESGILGYLNKGEENYEAKRHFKEG